METITVEITPTTSTVGMCREQCGRHASQMVTVRDGSLASSTFVCDVHGKHGRAHAVRMLSDLLRTAAVA